MTFEELAKIFRHANRKENNFLYPIFSVRWENGHDSVVNLLRRGLRELGFSISTILLGVVWFLYHDVWERCISRLKMVKYIFT